MFNGFFYSERGAHFLNRFLQSSVPSNVLLVVDPPFGGLLTALKTGIDTVLSTMHTGEIDCILVIDIVLWYYMETPNKGHVGTSHFVLCREVVLSLEVENILVLMGE